MFRAIETRRDFEKGDVFYLANLCHDCRACYYACMFTPPHEFAINIPQILSEARVESYKQWSWPGFLGARVQAAADRAASRWRGVPADCAARAGADRARPIVLAAHGARARFMRSFLTWRW